MSNNHKLSVINDDKMFESEKKTKMITKLQMRLFLALTELDRMVERVNFYEQSH